MPPRSSCACSKTTAHPWRDLTLENPIRAIREISHDITCRRRVRLANGRELSAIDIQAEYLNRALRFAKRHGLPPLEQKALEMWEHVMSHLEQDPLKLTTEVDWVIKHNLIESYRTRGALPLTHPRVALVDLAYHDVTRSRSLYYLLERRDQVERIVTDEEINEAINTPPQTTRARLRGAFIKRAKERKRDYTVDWVHLKLNDQAQRTVLVQGPFQVARRARRASHRFAVGAGARVQDGERRTDPRRTARTATRRGQARRPDRARLRPHPADRTGRIRRRGRRQHDRCRSRARDRRLARRALEPCPRPLPDVASQAT